MMLGLLLARAGVRVIVLEKHHDFLRDFRGDTLHPSSLEVMAELDLLDALLRLPHQEAVAITAEVGGQRFKIADFGRLPTRCTFIAFMPQWDFLNFLAEEASRYEGFELRMDSEAEGLITHASAVAGLRARTPEGELRVDADLVVAADGRGSAIRAAAGLEPEDLGAPIDVLWFRLPRRADDPEGPSGRFDAGRISVRLDRGDYWQCALVIRKGSFERIRARGLDAFRDHVAALLPFEPGRVSALAGWDDIKLLTVQINRLRRWWRPGLLCIGDAAHAMSPVGGVGINLAIQDAVAAANILAGPLRSGTLGESHLQAVQKRRATPAIVTQWLQVQAQRRILEPVLEEGAALKPPRVLRALDRWPLLRALPARLVGLGVRPEHVLIGEHQPAGAGKPDQSAGR